MDNTALKIDPDSRDLVIGDDGHLMTVSDDETTAQAVRLTLQTWKGEFFLDTTHGTDYERILGKKPHELPTDEIGEVIRAAILQESDVKMILEADANIGDKAASAEFRAELYSGKVIGMEVKT